MIGGPAGAVGGAAMGAIGFAVDESIAALCRTGFGVAGPNDNWVSIIVHDKNPRLVSRND